MSKFYQDLTYQKVLKWVNFWQSYSKKVAVCIGIQGIPDQFYRITQSRRKPVFSSLYPSNKFMHSSPFVSFYRVAINSVVTGEK